MSLLSKIEAALSEVGTELSTGEHALVAWIKRLMQHHKAGDIIVPPPQAGVGDGAAQVGSGVAATPVVTPAPAAAPVATAYPAIDADGCIKPAAFVGTPLERYRVMVQDTYDQPGLSDAVKANLLSNFNEDFVNRIQGNDSDPFSPSNITEGHNYMVPRMQPSNNPPPYGDVMVLPAKNSANNWPGFTLADCPAYVAHCQATGQWWKIDHTGVGAVA